MTRQEQYLVTLELPGQFADVYRLWVDVADLPLPVVLGALIEHGIIILSDATLKQDALPCTAGQTAETVSRLLDEMRVYLHMGKPAGPTLD